MGMAISGLRWRSADSSLPNSADLSSQLSRLWPQSAQRRCGLPFDQVDDPGLRGATEGRVNGTTWRPQIQAGSKFDMFDMFGMFDMLPQWNHFAVLGGVSMVRHDLFWLLEWLECVCRISSCSVCCQDGQPKTFNKGGLTWCARVWGISDGPWILPDDDTWGSCDMLWPGTLKVGF